MRKMWTLWLAVLALAGSLLSQAQPSNGVPPKIAPKAAAFDLREVQLLEGPFKAAMELNARYLLSLEADRLLSGVRRNAGLQPKAPRYGGWEAQGVAGQSLGHYMTALAQQCRATGDSRFLERLNYVVGELAECQAKDPTGYVAAIPDGKAVFEGMKKRGGRMLGWVPWYTMHKLFQGLRDAYRLTENEQAKAVLIRLTDWTDFVTKDLTEQETEIMLGMEHGGMAETLADVYAITGNPRHLATARRFCHRLVMDPLARGKDRLDGLHANTQIPKITGAARLHELTGEDYFGAVARHFWDFVVTNRSYVIGGNSDSEHFFPPADYPRHLSSATAETCNTYNMLKLTEHLFAWEPEARRMDFYERALYNQILASQDPRTGMFTYFIPMKPGHFKLYSDPTNAFWCCVGTGMENHTKYGEAIYARSADSLWVNLFIPSEVTWREKGLVLRQETTFPESETTRLKFKCANPTKLTLKLRWPAWVQTARVKVNGEPLSLAGGERCSYIPLDREWRDGDAVEYTLPMSLRTEPLPHSTNVQAVLYGPVVLAAELGNEGMAGLNLYQDNHNQNVFGNLPAPTTPVFVAAEREVLSHLTPVEGKPLTFQSRDLVQPREVPFIPFYRMHHQRYSVYFETFTPAEWTRRQTQLRAEEARKKAFEARILDDVRPGEQQSEVDHAFKGEKSSSGGSSPKWRDARNGGWFEYQLRVSPGQPAELLVTYWGGDGGNRQFDILVDGQKIATEKLESRRPNEFLEQSYAVPATLTRDKSRITVRFQGLPGNMAGGIFGLRLLRP